MCKALPNSAPPHCIRYAPACVELPDGRRITPSEAEAMGGCGNLKDWRYSLKTRGQDGKPISMNYYLTKAMHLDRSSSIAAPHQAPNATPSQPPLQPPTTLAALLQQSQTRASIPVVFGKAAAVLHDVPGMTSSSLTAPPSPAVIPLQGGSSPTGIVTAPFSSLTSQVSPAGAGGRLVTTSTRTQSAMPYAVLPSSVRATLGLTYSSFKLMCFEHLCRIRVHMHCLTCLCP